MDLAIMLVGWCGVWVFGAALIMAARVSGDWLAPGEIAWTKGAGFLVGAFVVTLWMRALSFFGIAFGVVSIVLPLALAAAVALVIAQRRATLPGRSILVGAMASLSARNLAGWQRVAWFALIGWLVVRYALLLVDVLLQPLYPWDAWIQWATKARVWFEFRRMVPFVGTEAWLAANGSFYTDAAPDYPATVSLWQVFGSVLLGRFDDALMNLPWWMVSVALTTGIYGALRRLGFAALAALAGAGFVATLPLANVHVALAGYADLPLAAYFTLAALALVMAFGSRRRDDWAVAMLLAIACPTLKTPGIVWLATLVAPLLVLLWPRRGVRLVLGGLALAIVALLVLAQTSATVLNYRLHLDFSPPWNGLFESLFMLGNWNILWYGIVAVAALGARRLVSPRVAPLTLLVATGLLFLFFVFAFTNARAWVDSQTTVNRAMLHLTPLLVVWMMMVFREWAETQPAAPPATAAPDAPAAT